VISYVPLNEEIPLNEEFLLLKRYMICRVIRTVHIHRIFGDSLAENKFVYTREVQPVRGPEKITKFWAAPEG